MSANRALSLKYAVESSGLYQSFLRILNRKLSITQRILPVVSAAGHLLAMRLAMEILELPSPCAKVRTKPSSTTAKPTPKTQTNP